MVAITTGYLDRDVLKQVLFLEDTVEWDEYLDILIRSVGDVIDQHTNRTFLSTGTQETRYFSGRGGGNLEIDDLHTFVTLKVDTNGDGTFDQALSEGTDFELQPFNDTVKWSIVLRSGGDLGVMPHGVKAVEVVGVWDWPSVPGSIEQAAMLMATRWFKRKETDYSDESLAQGVKLLDPDVIAMLQPYRRDRDEVLGGFKKAWG